MKHKKLFSILFLFLLTGCQLGGIQNLKLPIAYNEYNYDWEQEEAILQNSVLGITLPKPNNTIYHSVRKVMIAGVFHIQIDLRFDNELQVKEGYKSYYCKILENLGYIKTSENILSTTYQNKIYLTVTDYSGFFGYSVYGYKII